MAKARAAATPAKAKATKTSPAKASKANSPSPAKATRTSPRRATPSAKAQEAGDLGRIKAGRVAKASPAKKKKAIPAQKASPTKKTSPDRKTTPATKTTSTKKTTPAKKASPKKVAVSPRKTTPAKSPSPAKTTRSTRSTPGKSPAPATKAAKKASPAATSTSKKQQADKAERGEAYSLDDSLADFTADVQERCAKVQASMPSEADVIEVYQFLQMNAGFDGNAKEDDDERMSGFRTQFRKLKKEMRNVLGDEFDLGWKKRAPAADIEGLWRMLVAGEVGGERDVVRSTEPEEPVAHSPPRGRGRSPAKRATRTKSKSPAKKAAGSPANSPSRVASGRVTKGAASRSRSPVKRTQRQPSEVPATTRGQSSRKMLARSPSKSPANTVRRRSKSPLDSYEFSGPGVPTDVFMAGDVEPYLRHPRDRTPVRSGSARSRYIDDDAQDHTSMRSRKKRTVSVTRRSRSPAKRILSNDSVSAASVGRRRPSATQAAQPSSSYNRRSATQGVRGHVEDSEPGRGSIISPTNPENIAALNRPNPFYETLPAPEVWHRRMPPYFPFGETPYMEGVMSRQIDEDLKRGLEAEAQNSRRKSSTQSLFDRVRSSASSAISSMLGSKPQPEKKSYPSPWDLPMSKDEDVDHVARVTRTQEVRARRWSSDGARRSDEAFMSGGLGDLDGAH